MKKFLKVFFIFLVVIGLLAPFFSSLNIVLADTTSTLRPTADGGDDGADWKNTAGTTCDSADCYLELDESSGTSCTNSDGNTSFVKNIGLAAQTFDIDESSIPDNSTITNIAITICYKEQDSGGMFQTRECHNGSCSNSGTDISTSGSYQETTQNILVDYTKTSSSDIEIGMITTAVNVRISQVSTVITYTSSDTTAPADVTDLAASNATQSSIKLSWTAPGDDDNTGTANTYDVRYSTSAITEDNWSSATQATGEPTPSAAGSSEEMTISSLNSDTTYYFALKTSDEVPNESGLSNVPSLATSAPSDDTTAPAAVTDLSLSGATNSSITLSWTAQGDDDNTGTASTYDVRYSTSNITEGNWSSATQATGEPTPSAAGSSEEMTISSLNSDTTYYFALKTSDEVPNESGLSNVPSLATTVAAPISTPSGGGGFPSTAKTRKVVLSGQAYPGSKIEVVRKSSESEGYGRVPKETSIVQEDGTFNITYVGLVGGDYFLALRVEDKDGRKTGIISFNVDLRSEYELVAEDILVPPTIGFETSVVTKDKEIKMLGYAAPSSTIELEISDIVKQEARADKTGFWSFTMSTAHLSFGVHYVRARQRDQSGERTSNLSFPRVFKVSSLTFPRADFNNDNIVNITDWSIFLFRWGSEDQTLRSKIDMDDNEEINIIDFSIFLKTMKI